MTTTTMSKQEFRRRLQAALVDRNKWARRLTPAQVTREYLNPAAHDDIERAAARLYYAYVADTAWAHAISFGMPPWSATAQAARLAGERAYRCQRIVCDLLPYDAD